MQNSFLIKLHSTCFYEKCESYVDVYRHAYEGVTPHLWLNSSEDLSWQPICASAEKINSMFAKQIIDIDALFNEHVLVKNYNSAGNRKERWKNTTISFEQNWTQSLQADRLSRIKTFHFKLSETGRICILLTRNISFG